MSLRTLYRVGSALVEALFTESPRPFNPISEMCRKWFQSQRQPALRESERHFNGVLQVLHTVASLYRAVPHHREKAMGQLRAFCKGEMKINSDEGLLSLLVISAGLALSTDS